MRRDWMDQGCEHCRLAILSGGRLTNIALSIEQQAELRRCETCGAYWIVNMREAHVIDRSEAEEKFNLPVEG